MSAKVIFAVVVMVAACTLAAPADEPAPKAKRGLLGSVAVAHAPFIHPYAYGHAPITAYGYGLHAPFAAYHAPLHSFGYHGPILSHYHHHLF